jgi:uroporphyrinogen decarboxylase
MTELNGKERFSAFINRQEVDRNPWVPLAGIHFGKLKNYSARSVLTDSTKLLDSLSAANQEYRPDGLPVYFDTQVEAEILGCELSWADNATPSVITHPLKNHPLLPGKLPEEEDGRLPVVLETMRKAKARLGKTTVLFGLVTGPLTIAYHLRGNPLFYDLAEAPNSLNSLLDFTSRVTERMANLYTRAGMDAIGVIEPVASQISPQTFKTHLLKHYQLLFEQIHILDVFSMLHICGNATKIIDLMCQTGAQILSLDEKVQLPEIQPITEQFGAFLQGNIPVISHLLNGTPDDVYNYVASLLSSLPNPEHLILSPGCDLPWQTPRTNVRAAIEAISSDNTPVSHLN